MRPDPATRRVVASLFGLFLMGYASWTWSADEAATNVFDDPFVHATDGVPGCPVPPPPHYTPDEARAVAHERAQRGVSCYLAGQCRLMNSYAYDAEIVARAVVALTVDERYRDTSIWLLGQRRWVYVKGCVSSHNQRTEIVERVRHIDDVQMVFDELTVVEPGRSAPPSRRPSPNH